MGGDITRIRKKISPFLAGLSPAGVVVCVSNGLVWVVSGQESWKFISICINKQWPALRNRRVATGSFCNGAGSPFEGVSFKQKNERKYTMRTKGRIFFFNYFHHFSLTDIFKPNKIKFSWSQKRGTFLLRTKCKEERSQWGWD